jgi:hypothetical protein
MQPLLDEPHAAGAPARAATQDASDLGRRQAGGQTGDDQPSLDPPVSSGAPATWTGTGWGGGGLVGAGTCWRKAMSGRSRRWI